MNSIINITLVGFFVGMVGTGLGGIISLFFKNTSNKFLSSILGLTSGLMLSIVIFDLFPESYHFGGFKIALLGIILGVVLILILNKITPSDAFTSPFLRSGIIIGLSIALHNLPEGLAVGSSFMAKENMGISLAIIMLIHNIPEGLAMATPLKIGEYPNWKIVLITFLAGLPTGIGTFLGAYLGNISNTFIGFCLALAGGCMLYIICDDLLPNAKSLYGGKSINISILTGIFLGLLMIVYL